MIGYFQIPEIRCKNNANHVKEIKSIYCVDIPLCQAGDIARNAEPYLEIPQMEWSGTTGGATLPKAAGPFDTQFFYPGSERGRIHIQ
jgi:hypothetical protein